MMTVHPLVIVRYRCILECLVTFTKDTKIWGRPVYAFDRNPANKKGGQKDTGVLGKHATE